jgi:hypothetical protein
LLLVPEEPPTAVPRGAGAVFVVSVYETVRVIIAVRSRVTRIWVVVNWVYVIVESTTTPTPQEHGNDSHDNHDDCCDDNTGNHNSSLYLWGLVRL